MKEIYVRTKLVNGTYVYAPKGTANTYGTVLIDNNTLQYNGNKLEVNASVLNEKLNQETLNKIDEKLDKKLDKTAIVQETGNSTTKVMSQNAVRENFAHLVNGKVPESQLPSYVDDVVEYDSKSAFPAEGEQGIIYVDKSANLTYRWSGTTYIQVGGGDLNLENGTGTGSLKQLTKSSSGVPYQNEASGSGAIAFGKDTKSKGNSSFVIGQKNTATENASRGFVGGYDNIIDNATTFAFGQGLKNSRERKASFGQWNKDEYETLFEVGCGTSDEDRRNAFEVRDNGLVIMKDRAKVYVEPQDPTDVVRKQDLDKSQNDFNLENGTGKNSVQQKYLVDETDYSAQATGDNAVALSGKRYDKLNDINRTPTSAEGKQSFAAGGSVHAHGDWSAAFGKDTKAYQKGSVTFGGGTQAGRTEEQFYNYFWDNTTNTPINGGQGKNSDGEVLDNRGLTYSKSYSYGAAEGETTKALGRSSHSEGSSTQAIGEYSHTEGYISQSAGDASHSEGWNAKASGRASHSEGEGTRAEAVGSHAEGNMTKAKAPYSHSEGVNTEAQGEAAHSEGYGSKSIGNNSHSEGDTTTANGLASHSEGRETASNGLYSHAEGYKSKVQTTAYAPPTSSGGSGSGITEGEGEDDPTTHIGQGAHAEGILTISAGYATHAEGARTAASGMYSHAEGYGTYADGICHAEGYRTTATGGYSHSEGYNTVASHAYSHTEGYYTRSSREAQHVGGKYNADNPKALLIVGNGTSDTDAGRKNAFEVLENGRAKVQSAPVDDDDVVRKLELDKKLTSPNTPTADSVVTMAANGTVGTKKLGEFALAHYYKHRLNFEIPYGLMHIDIITSLDTAYTQPSQFISLINQIPAYVEDSSFIGFAVAYGYIQDGTTKFNLKGSGINPANPTESSAIQTIIDATFFSDAVTEL